MYLLFLCCQVIAYLLALLLADSLPQMHNDHRQRMQPGQLTTEPTTQHGCQTPTGEPTHPQGTVCRDSDRRGAQALLRRGPTGPRWRVGALRQPARPTDGARASTASQPEGARVSQQVGKGEAQLAVDISSDDSCSMSSSDTGSTLEYPPHQWVEAERDACYSSSRPSGARYD